jgi:hypothetical protein
VETSTGLEEELAMYAMLQDLEKWKKELVIFIEKNISINNA